MKADIETAYFPRESLEAYRCLNPVVILRITFMCEEYLKDEYMEEAIKKVVQLRAHIEILFADNYSVILFNLMLILCLLPHHDDKCGKRILRL
jgi:hypothetical protein